MDLAAKQNKLDENITERTSAHTLSPPPAAQSDASRSIQKMSKKKKSEQYGKPYTPSDFKQAGIGLLIIGIIAIIYGISAYRHGVEEQMLQTKGGTEIYAPTPPGSPLYSSIAIGGIITCIGGVYMWKRSKQKQSNHH